MAGSDQVRRVKTLVIGLDEAHIGKRVAVFSTYLSLSHLSLSDFPVCCCVYLSICLSLPPSILPSLLSSLSVCLSLSLLSLPLPIETNLRRTSISIVRCPLFFLFLFLASLAHMLGSNFDSVSLISGYDSSKTSAFPNSAVVRMPSVHASKCWAGTPALLRTAAIIRTDIRSP